MKPKIPPLGIFFGIFGFFSGFFFGFFSRPSSCCALLWSWSSCFFLFCSSFSAASVPLRILSISRTLTWITFKGSSLLTAPVDAICNGFIGFASAVLDVGLLTNPLPFSGSFWPITFSGAIAEGFTFFLRPIMFLASAPPPTLNAAPSNAMS